MKFETIHWTQIWWETQQLEKNDPKYKVYSLQCKYLLMFCELQKQKFGQKNQLNK